MTTLLQDLRYGFRQLFRNPVFTGVAVVTLVLGIGATTVIFTLANALLLRPLPVDDPATLVGFEELVEGRSPRAALSYPHFQAYREGSAGRVRLSATGLSDLALNADGEARVVLGGFVTGDFFEVLGLSPAAGRFFAPDEETPGVPAPVAVLSHDLWQQAFGGHPGAVGETIRANGQLLTVVGVAPRGFGGLMTGIHVDLWTLIPTYSILVPGSEIDEPLRQSWLAPFGRLAAGVGIEPAEALLSQVGRGIEPRWDNTTVSGVHLSRLSGIPVEARTPLRLFVALLSATAGLVLLIACVNVAGMLLARATARRREVGIRLALGAGRPRLVAQLLTESSLLFLLGGAGALLLASWIGELLVAFQPALPVPVTLDLGLDWRVAGFALAVSLGTGLLFGLAPALKASRPDVVSSLKAGGAGAGEGRSRLRSGFVVGQISLSLLLLVTAGLFTRSLQRALAVDTGIDPSGVLVAGLDLDPHGYDEETGTILLGQLLERLRSHPDVRSVGLAQFVPLGFNQVVAGVEIPGHEPPEGRSTIPIDYNRVDGGYFETVGLPIVQGRPFDERDSPDAAGAVIVNETMARRFWPGGDALGASIRWAGTSLEIIGIARDAKYYSLSEEPLPFLYLPQSRHYGGSTTLHVRGAGEAGRLEPLVRAELRRLDPDVPLVQPASLERRITVALLPQRIAAALIGVFGATGLLLAAVGLYGILAYSVSRRSREIGVRLALGARSGTVLRMIVRQGLTLLALGVVIGLALAFAATRLVAGFLHDVSPMDPLTFLAVCLLLGATALAASVIPALRATQVDPVVALRAE